MGFVYKTVESLSAVFFITVCPAGMLQPRQYAPAYFSDTGIGIAPEDLPRIFEKGYTGGNGHENKRSSGLGLYLCRQICDRLGLAISIESEVESGTTVRLDLDQRRMTWK